MLLLNLVLLCAANTATANTFLVPETNGVVKEREIDTTEIEGRKHFSRQCHDAPASDKQQVSDLQVSRPSVARLE